MPSLSPPATMATLDTLAAATRMRDLCPARSEECAARCAIATACETDDIELFGDFADTPLDATPDLPPAFDPAILDIADTPLDATPDLPPAFDPAILDIFDSGELPIDGPAAAAMLTRNLHEAGFPVATPKYSQFAGIVTLTASTAAEEELLVTELTTFLDMNTKDLAARSRGGIAYAYTHAQFHFEGGNTTATIAFQTEPWFSQQASEAH